eukprot:SAG11_NODE_983_length_6306_cov_19.831319_9_plen_82_part_00
MKVVHHDVLDLYSEIKSQLPSVVQTPGGQKCQNRGKILFYIKNKINAKIAPTSTGCNEIVKKNRTGEFFSGINTYCRFYDF